MMNRQLLGGLMIFALMVGGGRAVADPSPPGSPDPRQSVAMAEVAITVNVPAAIIIDGVHLADAPLPKPLKLSPGDHAISVVAQGYLPARRAVTVPAEGTLELAFELEATEAKLAHVTVYSPLRDVEVKVDDVFVGKTPLAEPVMVEPGRRVFELERPGYVSLRRTLNLGDGVYSSVSFDPEEDESAEAPRGKLRLVGGTGVGVTIDGHERGRYRAPIELPTGYHALRLERVGYQAREQTFEVADGQEIAIDAALLPTVEARSVAAARVRTYRLWAVAALVSGAVVAGGSTGLAVWANHKLSPAESELTAVQQQTQPGQPCSPALITSNDRSLICQENLANAQNPVSSYRDWRLGGFIGIGVGAALLATGVTLLAVAPRSAISGPGGPGFWGALTPEVVAAQDGLRLRLGGRF
ncbi:MAG: PEGA domain-containing protein [Polyangia bacterium]|jgi:hypothetical protein